MKNKIIKIIAVCLSIICLLSLTVSANVTDNNSLQTSETDASDLVVEKNDLLEGIKEEAGLLTALSIIPEEVDFHRI